MTEAIELEDKIEEKIKSKIEEPGRYNVIFVNDDLTPMDFVAELLVVIFRHSAETARDLTMVIHDKGSAIVGNYTYEVAEQKGVETTKLARENSFPLQVIVEKE